jgi:hypothetical protein
MAILGLLILAAAAVFGVETALSNRGADVGFEVFGTSYTAPVSVLFLLGAITMAVAILGTFMITGALQRRRTRRLDARDVQQREETHNRVTTLDTTNRELVEENDRLRAELNDHRRAAATMGGVAVPAGAGDVSYGDQVSDAVRSDTISDTGRFEPYPVDHGNDAPVNTEEGRYDDSHEKVGILSRFRGNS